MPPSPLLPAGSRWIHRTNRALIIYVRGFLGHERQDALLRQMTASTSSAPAPATSSSGSVPWRVETDDFGVQGRESYYAADPGCVFSYVGLRLSPNPWTEGLDAVRADLNALAAPLVAAHLGLAVDECRATATLCNHYPEGEGEVRRRGKDDREGVDRESREGQRQRHDRDKGGADADTPRVHRHSGTY